MAKIIKLTESDLTRIVERVLSEQITPSQAMKGAFQGATGMAPVIQTIITLINGSDAASKKVWKIINTCEKNNFPMTVRTNKIADTIYNAITGLGTDENAVYSAMSQPRTLDEFCGVAKSYVSSYGEKLWDALKGDFSSESEWVQIMRPLRDVALKTQQMQKNKMVQQKPQTTGGAGKPAAQPQAKPTAPRPTGQPQATRPTTPRPAQPQATRPPVPKRP